MLTFTVDKETGARKLYLNCDKADEPALRAHIQKVKAEGKTDVQAVIAADKAASHGEVIRLIDIVKQEGIVKFALNIESGSG